MFEALAFFSTSPAPPTPGALKRTTGFNYRLKDGRMEICVEAAWRYAWKTPALPSFLRNRLHGDMRGKTSKSKVFSTVSQLPLMGSLAIGGGE
jgi:hypothetical protein